MLRSASWFVLVLVGCDAWSAGSGTTAGAVVASEPAVVGTGALKAAIAAGMRPRGANEASFEVDAFVAALAVEELAGGGGGVRVEPAVEGGAQVGYRVLEVVPGSAYALLGLRAGDVVEAIGDVKLDSPGRAAGLVGAFGRGGTIAVIRDGVGFSIEVRIAGGVSWAELLRARTGSPGQVVADSSLGTGSNGQVAEDRAIGAGGGEPAAGDGGGDLVNPFAGGGGGSAPAGAGHGTEGLKNPFEGSKPTGTGLKDPFRGESSSGSDLKDPFSRSPTPTGAHCATAASCTLDKKVFDDAVANPGKLERQVSVAPTTGGYKLTKVSPGSTVAGLGFRTGDVITTVNGARLDDDMAALGLYMELGSTRNYTVAYRRNGVKATKSIAVK